MYSTLDLMHVWINYIIEKKCYLRLKWPTKTMSTSLDKGGAFGQETSGDTYTINQN